MIILKTAAHGAIPSLAGISNLVAAETSDDNHGVMLDFMRTFYSDLVQGRTLRESFDAGVQR